MKDLFVLTADADAQALIRAVLQRHQNLNIKPISFEVQRFTGRDAGMVKAGPEIVRAMVKKTEYSRIILVWDHHGSGWDKLNPTEAATRVERRLEGVTWTQRSAGVVVVPELEEWLWHCPADVARHLGANAADFETSITRALSRMNLTREQCCRERRKELFEAVVYYKKRRKPLPEDFEALGSSCDLSQWVQSETFARFVQTLRSWFPAA